MGSRVKSPSALPRGSVGKYSRESFTALLPLPRAAPRLKSSEWLSKWRMILECEMAWSAWLPLRCRNMGRLFITRSRFVLGCHRVQRHAMRVRRGTLRSTAEFRPPESLSLGSSVVRFDAHATESSQIVMAVQVADLEKNAPGVNSSNRNAVPRAQCPVEGRQKCRYPIPTRLVLQRIHEPERDESLRMGFSGTHCWS